MINDPVLLAREMWYSMNMSDRPASRQDLADAVRHTDEKLQQTTEKLTEAIRDSQTEVLTAFYNWARDRWKPNCAMWTNWNGRNSLPLTDGS